MFNLRRETDYAIQFLKECYRNKAGYLSLREASDATGISFHFLQKIARKLRLARLIKGEKGVEGGYCLNMSPEKINLKVIVEAMEGHLAILPCHCPDKTVKCIKANEKCVLKSKMRRLNNEIRKSFESIKLNDL